MDEVSTQLRKGSLELAVLALLSVEPRYGADVVENLAGRPGLEATSGTIYPLLTRLKNARLVATSWHESPVGPPRKYYELTPSGARHLAAQRDAWERLSRTMTSLLREVEK